MSLLKLLFWYCSSFNDKGLQYNWEKDFPTLLVYHRSQLLFLNGLLYLC